jgi:hypothetical protein
MIARQEPKFAAFIAAHVAHLPRLVKFRAQAYLAAGLLHRAPDSADIENQHEELASRTAKECN